MKSVGIITFSALLAIVFFLGVVISSSPPVVAAQETLPQYSGLYGVQWSPDGIRLLAGEENGLVVVWDAFTGEELHRFDGHDTSHFDGGRGRWSPDGTRIVTYSSENTARVWDVESGALLYTLGGHSGDVVYALFSPDGQRIVTISIDSTARVWDASTGELLVAYSGHSAALEDAEWSDDGTRIATASDDGTAHVWGSATGETLLVLQEREPNPIIFGGADFTQPVEVWGVTWSPDESRILVTGTDGIGMIYDAVSGAVENALVVPFQVEDDIIPHLVVDGYWSADGTRIILHTSTYPITLWDAETGEQMAVLPGHVDLITRALWSPDNERILTSGVDGTLRLWDGRTGAARGTIETQESIWSAAYSPDGFLIATTSSVGTLRVWDASTGQEQQFVYPANTEPRVTWELGPAMGTAEAGIMMTLTQMPIFGVNSTLDIGANTETIFFDGVPVIWDYSGIAGEVLTFTIETPLPIRLRVLAVDGTIIGESEMGSLTVSLPQDGQYQVEATNVDPLDEYSFFEFTLNFMTSRATPTPTP